MYGYFSEKARGIHLLDRWGKDCIDPRLAGLAQVALHVARIRGKVLLWPELFRVDKNRHHHHITCLPSCMHQAEMTSVQISHGGYQANTFAGGARRCQECAESVHCIKNLHDVYTLLPATSPASQGLSISLDVERDAGLTLASHSGMAVCP